MSVVVLEDLNVRGMLQKHHLAQATPARATAGARVADVGMAEFRRQLTYKGACYGCAVATAKQRLC